MNPSFSDSFRSLSAPQRRVVLFALVGEALARWREYAEAVKLFEYQGTDGASHSLDLHLPPDAYATASTGGDSAAVKRRYEGPIAALRAGGLAFPVDVAAAFDSIYDLFRLYACGESVDEGALAERALDARPVETREARFEDAMKRARL